MRYPEDAAPVNNIEEPTGPDSERLPPHNIEVEQQVLGAMMLNRQAIDKAHMLLDRQMFYRGRHREIYEAMVRLNDSGRPVDLTMLSEELEGLAVLMECGGPAYLADIAASVGTSSNVEYHAQILVELAIRRRLIVRCQKMITDAYDGSQPIDETTGKFNSDFEKITASQAVNEFRPIREFAELVERGFEEAAAAPGVLSGVPTGFPDLDDITAGFQRGELTILGARPGMGKTALSLNIARYITAQVGLPVGFFSLEMSGESLARRLICSEARVDSQIARMGQLSDEAWNRITPAMSEIAQSPLWIDDTPGIRPRDVRAKTRRLVHEQHAAMIIVDYIGLAQPDAHRHNRWDEVGEIAASFKALAKELDIPVLILSQITRESTKRGNNRPTLTDLRESGKQEEHADMIWFIHRPEYYGQTHDEDGHSLEGEAEIIVAKQRNGPTGTAMAHWIAAESRFSPWSDGEKQEWTNAETPTTDGDEPF